MDGRRHSITAQQNAAIAAHLQAQQHQVYAQAQQQVAAAAIAQHQRSSSFVWHQQGANNATAPPVQNGYPNVMPSMYAIQSNMNQMALVATAKLAPYKKKCPSNSNLTVRTSVPRSNVAGGIYTVAQWARKCVEDNLDFVVKIARRDNPKADLVMLAYGDGCQTLVFFDGAMNNLPDDLSKIKKIHVGVSTAPIDDKRTGSEMAGSGVLQPIDSLWDHLRYEQANSTKDKEKIMFFHTSMKVYGDSDIGRRRVLQIKTKAPESPFVAVSYMRNVMFEQQVLAKWKGEVPGDAPIIAVQPTTAAAVPPTLPSTKVSKLIEAEKETTNEYLITFNPKELLLLEKAFHNTLTSRDLKSKAEKWTDEDQKKCQLTILRAQNEFKFVPQRKAYKKKPKTNENDGTGENMDSDDSKKPAAEKVLPTSVKKIVPTAVSKNHASKNAEQPKGNSKKANKSSMGKKKDESVSVKSSIEQEQKDEPIDSDDEPIVKLKTPSKKVTPAKKAKSNIHNEKKKKIKTEVVVGEDNSKKATPSKKVDTQSKGKDLKKSVSKKRGREKSLEPSSKKTPKKTRSSSKSRNSRSKRSETKN